MKSLTGQLPSVLALLLVTVFPLRAESPTQGEAVVRLLNLFAARTDPVAVTNAGKLLSKGGTPVEVIISDLHLPVGAFLGWTSPETTRLKAKNLGEYVAEHPHEFDGGLPDAESIHDPLRLEAFFDGLFHRVRGASADHFDKNLARISPLLDDSWLEAARNCGSETLRQLILVYRGELQSLLMNYQDAEDDIGVIVLGESLASWSAAYQQIQPEGFASRMDRPQEPVRRATRP